MRSISYASAAITIFFLFFRQHSFEVTFETMGSFQISIPPHKWSGKEYKWNRRLAPRSLMEALHFTCTNTNTRTIQIQTKIQKCGRVNNPAPYFPKTHSTEVIGVYLFSLRERRHTMTRTKRAKRMTDWANVRMIKDGTVLMENENTQNNQNHSENIFSRVFRHSCTVSFLWNKRNLYLGQILVSTSIWWYLGIYLSPIRMEAVWRLHRSYPDEIFVCK